MGEMTSILLGEGKWSERVERDIVNDTDGPMLVWDGQKRLATLAPGERAVFTPKMSGWTQTPDARRKALDDLLESDGELY